MYGSAHQRHRAGRRRLGQRKALDQAVFEALEKRQLLSTNVLTFHNDPQRDGVNSTETALTPANVKVGSFGKLYTTALDGNAYAQPLVVSGETIKAGVNTTFTPGTYDVVYVETENDSIYAINTGNGTVLWQRSFLSTTFTGLTAGTDINNPMSATSIAAPLTTDVGSTDIAPVIGITGTPVIDLTHNCMYVIPKTKEVVGGVTHFVQRLHAISLSDGTDIATPYQIGDTTGTNTNNTNIYAYGNGDGCVTDPYNKTGKKVVQFNALRENQRTGLSLVNGTLYVAWASHSDQGPYHGWIATWNVSNLTTSGMVLSGVLCTSPNGAAAGIWISGGALTFDPDSPGTFYFETGNGSGNPNGTPLDANGFPVGGAYYEAVVKATFDATTSPTNQNVTGWGLKVTDYFIPYNQSALDNTDQDLGGSSPVTLPDSAGIPGHPHLLVAGGKQGVIYLIDRDNMGKYNPVNDNVVNAVPNGSGNNTPPVSVSGVLSTPVFYNGLLYYVSGYSGPAESFSISSTGQLVATSQSATGSFGFLPGSPALSANGTQNGIVWQTNRNLNELDAFNAGSYATLLWSSNQKAGGGDALGSVVKFATPTVANGEVFVGTSNSLVAYGLTPPPATLPLAPALTATALSSSSVNLTWTDATPSTSAATGYFVEESTDDVHFTQVTTSAANTTALAVGGLSAGTTYYFRIRSQNPVGFSPYSNVASATTTKPAALVLDGSFETTRIGSYQYDPATANWTFTGLSGLIANGGVSEASNAPDGTQIAFVESNHSTGGSFAQALNVATAGSYQLAFAAAQVQTFGTEPITVSVDGTAIATITPTSLAFQNYNAPIVTLTAGQHVLSFSTATITATDSASVIDAVQMVATAAPSAPNAPSALGAVPASATSVNLTWTANSTNQTKYLLDRATDSAFTQNLVTQTLSASPASFTDTAGGLASGGTYYYRVRAASAAGSSANSNVAGVAIPFAPAKATNFAFDSVTATSINMHWTDVAGTTATGYQVLRAVNGGAFVPYATLPGLNTTAPTEYDWSDTGLTPGSLYDYHIEAFNVAGYNDFVGGNARTLTSAPTGLAANASGSSISLTWTAPAGASTYNVYRGTNAGGEAATPIAMGLTATGYTDTAVTAAATYYYYVAAVNSNLSPLNSIGAASAEVSAASTTAAVTGASVPGQIEAEDYDAGGEGVGYHDTDPANLGGAYRNDGVDIETTTDGGYDVGWTHAGEWLDYTINVTSAGSYALDVRVASALSGGAFHVEVDGANVTGAMSLPNTGGWQNWTTLTTNISLPSGKHVLRLVMDASPNGFTGNFNWLKLRQLSTPTSTPFSGTPVSIPGTVQAENYDLGGEGLAYHDTDAANNGGAYRGDGVDLETTTDSGGGYDVGWIRAGEWLNYTISVPTAGSYVFSPRVANVAAGGAFHVEIDHVDVSGTLTIPNTGGWQTYTTINSAPVTLTAGTHVMRLVFDTAASNGFVGNVNYVTINAVTKLTGTVIGTSGSNQNSGNAIADVFDGNLSTFFDAPDGNLSDWAGLDLGSARTVTQIKYAPRAGFESRMVGGQFQASTTANFSSNVVTLYTITTAPIANQLTAIPVSLPTPYRYFRYVGGTQWVNIAEMEVDGF